MADVGTIKELRDATGFSFKEIGRALEEAGGDKARAIEILKAHGASVAQTKSARRTDEGIVEAYIHSNKKIASLVELLCETDFVARNPMFLELAHELAMHVAAMDPESVSELVRQPFIRDQDITVAELIQQSIAKLGENIRVGKFIRFQI